MFRLLLVYNKTAKYSDKIPYIVSTLVDIENRWKINYSLLELENLSDGRVHLIESHIHQIIPQNRGKIISSGGNILPVSHSKKLNITNTPILMMYDDEIPLQVYPHMLGEAYITVEDGLSHILKEGQAIKEDSGLIEGPLQRLLASNPTMFDDGSSCLGIEVDVGVGVADLILEGRDGRYIIVEIKNHADDSTIGQISRIAEGYAVKKGIDSKDVRKAIVCIDYGRTLKEACLGANVELYRLCLERR